MERGLVINNQQVNTMKKNYYNMFFFLFFTLSFFVFHTSGTIAEEKNAFKWSVADMLPVESGISVFRYGAIGFGAYPYGSVVPSAGLRV